MQPSPVPTTDIAGKLDALFITHEHGDHFNAQTAAILAEKSDCVFVLPASCTAKATSIGIPGSRIHIARPDVPFDLMGCTLNPSAPFMGTESTRCIAMPIWMIVAILKMAGKRLLQPGDSVLLQDHLECKDIDILFVSPTEHNMHIDAAATLIRALEPAYIFPQHFGTYRQDEGNRYWTQGFPDELKAELPEHLQERFHKLQQGEI